MLPMTLWFVTFNVFSYFTLGNLQIGRLCPIRAGGLGKCSTLFNCPTLDSGGFCNNEHKWIVCCPVGTPRQRRPWINEVDSNANLWNQPNRNFRRPQEINIPQTRGTSFNNGNNNFRIPSRDSSIFNENSREPEVNIYEWSQPLNRESYPSNANNRILSNNNNNWNRNSNTRPNNLWTDNDQEERPIWDREINTDNQPRPEPEINRNPLWREEIPRVPDEDLIEDRQPATARPPVQSSAQLPLNSIILRRKVGLKSLEMCKKFCKKSIIPLSIDFASRFGGTDTNLDPLIVGGRESKEKEFPHMAAIGYGPSENIEWKCGGSLISEFYVLTAAHCATTGFRQTADWVLLGSTKLITRYEALNRNHQLITVQNRLKHPDYKSVTSYNDIALLRLSQSATFNDFVRPACLPVKRGFKPQAAVASGWGLTNFRNPNSKSEILLDVTLRILEPIHCNNSLGQARQLPRGTDDKLQICAGALEGNKDTCRGDSGGPLQIQEGDCGITVVGIVSFGSEFCGDKLSAGVYTRVESYIQWIEDIVWPPLANERIIVHRPT